MHCYLRTVDSLHAEPDYNRFKMQHPDNELFLTARHAAGTLSPPSLCMHNEPDIFESIKSK